jgi:hypothetical protein
MLGSRVYGVGVAVLLLAAGLMLPGVSQGERIVSRAVTVHNTGEMAASVDQAEGRAFSIHNLGPEAGPIDQTLGRVFTFQNVGEVAASPDETFARAWTLLNLGEAAPPPSSAYTRSFTTQNVGLELAEVLPWSRAFTTQNLPVIDPPAGDESIARAFTVRQTGESMAPTPSEAFGRAVTLRNLGFLDEPGIDEVVGRPFTVQNAGEVIDVPVTPGELLPIAFQLYANTPNPFRQSTTIRYDLPRSSPINIRVYDVAGRMVKVLVHSKKHDPGRFVIDWNGRDQNGRALSSGVYFYRMRADSFQQNQRLVLVRD